MCRNRRSGYRSLCLWNFTTFVGMSRRILGWCLNTCRYRSYSPAGHSQYITGHRKISEIEKSCLIAELCLCWLIQIFKGLMILKHTVLRNRRKVMCVFFRLKLHAHFRLSLQAPSPVLSRVIRSRKSLSNSLYEII